MTVYIALLRAVNVAGHNRVSMAELKILFERLRFHEVQTLLQTGNLVFRAETQKTPALERLLEDEATKRLGLETEFFVRTAAEWRSMIDANPFPAEARLDPGHLLAVSLKGAPDREQVTSLRGAITGREIVQVRGRTAYIVYPDGAGRSRLTPALIERHLATTGTGRNWNTVVKLGALARGKEE